MPEPVTTAVILARGLGTRMRRSGAALDPAAASVADQGLKALIPIGRPFIDFVLYELAEAGISEVVLVVAPGENAVRDHCAGLHPRRLTLRFAVQETPRGTADAVASAGPLVAGRRFLVLNADNHYPHEVLRQLRSVPGAGLVGFSRRGLLSGNIAAARLAGFALAVDDGTGHLGSILEKPDPAQLAAFADAPLSMNCWCFTPAILDACRTVTPSVRGELELPDAVRLTMAKGERYRLIRSDAAVLDLSSRDDVASVRAALEGKEVKL